MSLSRMDILKASVIGPFNLLLYLTWDTPSLSLSESAVENPPLPCQPRIKDHRSTQKCLSSHWTL